MSDSDTTAAGGSDASGPVTQLLDAAASGKAEAAAQLFPIVYDQLVLLARAQMQHEAVGHTLQATALVHEAYLRLIGSEQVSWASRAQFFHAAANAMRKILIDYARKRGRLKRGGDRQRVPFEVLEQKAESTPDELLSLDASLDQLEKIDERAASIVKLRFFAGLGVEDTAAALNISERTVKREWAFARAWMFQFLQAESE